MAFAFISQDSTTEQTQQKELDDSRVSVVIPLSMVVSSSQLPPANYRCWVRAIRSDNWIGLIPVSLRHVQLDPVPQFSSFSPTTNASAPTQPPPVVSGTVTYVPLTTSTGGLDGAPMEDRHVAASRVEHVFCDAASLSVGTMNIFEDTSWTNVL